MTEPMPPARTDAGIRELPRLVRTVRYLRPAQIWGRVWMKVQRPSIDTRPAPARRPAAGRWSGCARRRSLAGPATLRFLNIEHVLRNRGDWNPSGWSYLWLYNLHYFDDLVADDAPQRTRWHRDLMARWIAENPPGEPAGWMSYPTSLRIVNWIKWTLSGQVPGDEILQSLAVQARWLRGRLEWHLLGNHLWANAKALVFAGVFFEGEEAARWLRRGKALLHRELAEQILPDGGHFERSPMYHATVLEDVLDLLQLARLYPGQFDAADSGEWQRVAQRMLHWLRLMSHPDGEIALFNDAAPGVAPDVAALSAYATNQGVGVGKPSTSALEVLAASGYVRMQAGEAVLIADVGEIGPDYLPGHAHADTLSFELSLGARRVLVNGGTSTYAPGPQRVRERGTAAHNTVVVDGKDSSEVWAEFRVGRRARPHDVAWGIGEDGPWLRAAHDGYTHLPGRPIHQREWLLGGSGLCVRDRIEGGFRHAEACFRVAPGWQVATADGGAGSLRGAVDGLDTWIVAWHSRPGARVVDAECHPAFSLTEACRLIEVPLDAHGASFTMDWGREAGGTRHGTS